MKKDLILVINCGSSSLKFSLINPLSGDLLLSGLAECLLSSQATIKFKQGEESTSSALLAPFDHERAISALVNELQQLSYVEHIFAIGHRVVHGGEHYCSPTLISSEVKDVINELARLAPLHNPANLIGIQACERTFTNVPQIAIFDTAFHQTMPETAYIYGIPYALYKEHGVRRYGFHGTSHDYVSSQAALLVNKPRSQCNFISAHLGNGCSIVAIKNGKSVDTSLGLTPLEGVMMGTRSGDVDPGIIFHLVEQLGYSLTEVNTMLNKNSGLLGISGISNDCRTLEAAVHENNNHRALLALDVFSYRIAKSIASFTASLEQLDGLIFTGGIGENSMYIRSKIVAHLGLLNFKVDAQKNETIRFGRSGLISAENSRACWVIPTNEEWVIAKQSYELLEQSKIKE